MMINVQFSDQELLALRNMLDLAVKSGGMSVAEACVVLDRKMLEAARAATAEQQKQEQPQE